MTTPKITAGTVWWESGLAIDADGAPNAYGPSGGLDYLANAGSPGNWYGIVTDSEGNPVVQGPQDPHPGYYVSTTALVDHSKAATDPRRYVDSTSVPYVSVPSELIRAKTVSLGDVGFVHCRSTGQDSACIVADVGPRGKYGEGSIALADALGVPSSPKNGGAASGVVIVIFRGSSRGWPRSNEDVAQQVQDLINVAGGFQQFLT